MSDSFFWAPFPPWDLFFFACYHSLKAVMGQGELESVLFLVTKLGWLLPSLVTLLMFTDLLSTSSVVILTVGVVLASAMPPTHATPPWSNLQPRHRHRYDHCCYRHWWRWSCRYRLHLLGTTISVVALIDSLSTSLRSSSSSFVERDAVVDFSENPSSNKSTGGWSPDVFVVGWVVFVRFWVRTSDAACLS